VKGDAAGLTRRTLVVLSPTFGLIALSGLLPRIDLDGKFADAMVRVSETASWKQMPFLCLAAVILLATRPGLATKRRLLETAMTISAMAIVLPGNGLLNEHVVKPAVGIPRPNIVTLAEDGVLGPEIDDGDAFYAVGDKEERRALLHERLIPSQRLGLSQLVRAHWVDETGYALPSGHVASAMTLAALWAGLGVLWLSGRRRAAVIIGLAMWAVAVAYSRVLLGVHTVADVTVGALVGIGWGLATVYVIREVYDRFSTSRAIEDAGDRP